MLSTNTGSVIILGGGESQIPSIVSASVLGFDTVVIDPSQNCPGGELADKFMDINMIDHGIIIKNLHENVTTISGVVTNAADFPVPLVASINNEFNLNGPSVESAFINTNKIAMREELSKTDIICPIWRVVRNASEAVNICLSMKNDIKLENVVFKPSNSSGGRGIFVISLLNCSDLEYQASNAYNYSSKFNKLKGCEVLVEEMIEGDEFSIESLTAEESDSVIVAITNKYTSGPPYFVEIAHSQPCTLNDELQKLLKETTLQVLKVLKVKYAPGHTEIKIRNMNGKFQAVIMESACRLGGGNISLLTKKNTTIDLVEASIQLATGNWTSVQSVRDKLSSLDGKLPACAVQMLFFKSLKSFPIDEVQIIKKIKGVSDVYSQKGVFHCMVVGRPGDIVHRLVDDSCRYGSICCEGSTVLEALERATKAAELVKFDITSSTSENSKIFVQDKEYLDPDVNISIPIFDSLAHPRYDELKLNLCTNILKL